MKIGFIGLGKMGKNMVFNLLDKGHEVVANNRSNSPIDEVAKKGAIPAYTIDELTDKLKGRRKIWLMVPASVVDKMIEQLLPKLKKGDMIIDGGNSWYKDSIKRYNYLKKKGIDFIDVGTSGGVEGARYGACMMAGGDKQAFNKVNKLLKDMCVKNGYGYMGNAGAGHFVKMVHNGIEYGMMGALAEGFLAIKEQQKKFNTDLKEVSKVYSNGSIIEGRLVKWLWNAYETPGYMENISCEVPKGKTEDEMKELEKLSHMPVLHESRMLRSKSRKNKFCGKIISALRNQFGGHEVIKRK